MSKSMRYAPEVRERAVRLVQEAQKDHQSQWAAIQSIAEKIGVLIVRRQRIWHQSGRFLRDTFLPAASPV